MRVVDVHGVAELYEITAFEGGFVAGGCRLLPPSGGSDSGCGSAYALLSRDGASWSEVSLPDATDAVMIVGLADTPLGVLAFGSTLRPEPPQARTIWRLAADGRWEIFPMPAPLSIVFHSAPLVNGRTAFLGYDTAYDLSTDTEVWTTADGTSWTHGTTPVTLKVAAAPGLVAVGRDCVDVCAPDSVTSVKRSGDATTWTEASIPPELAMTSVEALAAWDGRALVGGFTADGSASGAVLWLDSPAGWRQITLEDGIGYSVSSLIVSTQGVIAVGRALGDDPPVTWWSTDAVAWSPISLAGLRAGYIAASTAASRLVVIVNFDSIWASDL